MIVQRRYDPKRVMVFIILSIIVVSFIYPLYFMLINSFKTRTEYYINPFSLPKEGLQINNYITMISQFRLLNLFKNTLIISLGTVILLLIIGILSSYVFAKIPLKGKMIIFLAALMTMFVPSQVTIIPLYVGFSKVGLVNTYFSVILAYLALFLPEAILLMTANFKSIPDELLEAAEINGCNYFQKIWYVVIPMGRNAIFLAIIFYFIMSWNDLFTPMILLTKMEKRTVMVALAALMGRYSGSPTFQFAGLLLSAIPALIVYFIFQKRIIQGMSFGAIK